MRSYENSKLRMLFAEIPGGQLYERVWLGGKFETGKLSWSDGCYPAYNNIGNFYGNQSLKSCVAMNYGGIWLTE